MNKTEKDIKLKVSRKNISFYGRYCQKNKVIKRGTIPCIKKEIKEEKRKIFKNRELLFPGCKTNSQDLSLNFWAYSRKKKRYKKSLNFVNFLICPEIIINESSWCKFSNERDSIKEYKRIKWAWNNGNPICPHCYCIEYYAIPARSGFKCKSCRKLYNETTNTIFSGKKIAVSILLEAINSFLLENNRHSFCKKARVTYKTAFIVRKKIEYAAFKIAIESNLLGIDLSKGHFINKILNSPPSMQFKGYCQRYLTK